MKPNSGRLYVYFCHNKKSVPLLRLVDALPEAKYVHSCVLFMSKGVFFISFSQPERSCAGFVNFRKAITDPNSFTKSKDLLQMWLNRFTISSFLTTRYPQLVCPQKHKAFW
jgi:hypothetical protein